MRSGLVRVVVATVLIVVLGAGAVRNVLAIASMVGAGVIGPYAVGTAVGALVPLLGLVGSILLLRSGIRRRRATRSGPAVADPVPDGTARHLELAREYPEERWTSLPLDEEQVATWLTSRAFAEEDGSPVTADGLRSSSESERSGTVRQLVHRYGYVRITVLSSFSRLRGLAIELLVDDAAIRAEITADLQVLAEDLGGLTLRAAQPEHEPEPVVASV
ncbi:hypothetical protein [uncultured Amnibacterium sp.]|uniref:hypothetical protein n=1 Tax=uncultured Amnibacterium sp. TaxID=1631851 RepID=UPI0035CB79A5